MAPPPNMNGNYTTNGGYVGGSQGYKAPGFVGNGTTRSEPAYVNLAQNAQNAASAPVTSNTISTGECYTSRPNSRLKVTLCL